MKVDNEIITAGTPWYCPFTSVQKSTLVGTKIHGVKKACEIALKAHREEVAENDVLIFSLDTVLSAEMTKVNMHYLHLVFQREQLFMVSCDWMGLHDWRGWWPGLFWRKHGCLQISSLHHSQASNSTCPRGSTSAFFIITSFAQQKGTSLEMQTSGFNFFKKFHVLLYLYYWRWAKYIILQFRIKNKIQMRS